MKRLTVVIHDDLMGALRAVAQRRGISMAEATREALTASVSRHQGKRRPLSLAGIERSGRSDVAERAEELLKIGFRLRQLKSRDTSLRSGRQLGGSVNG